MAAFVRRSSNAQWQRLCPRCSVFEGSQLAEVLAISRRVDSASTTLPLGRAGRMMEIGSPLSRGASYRRGCEGRGVPVRAACPASASARAPSAPSAAPGVPATVRSCCPLLKIRVLREPLECRRGRVVRDGAGPSPPGLCDPLMDALAVQGVRAGEPRKPRAPAPHLLRLLRGHDAPHASVPGRGPMLRCTVRNS